MDTKPTQTVNKALWVVFISAVLAITGYGVYVYLLGDFLGDENPVILTNTATNFNTNNASNANITIDTAGWKTYTSTHYEYGVKYPPDGNYNELTSGIEGVDDRGYIVDFSINGVPIRITAYENSRGDKTLEQLIEVRNNIGMPLFVTNSNEYQTININSQRAFKYLSYLNGDKKSMKIGLNTILLNDKYYYQITTGNQFSPEFTLDKENVYDAFVNTFQTF